MLVPGEATQVHPRACTCRTCGARITAPLDRATPADLARALLGLIPNRTAETLHVAIHHRLLPDTSLRQRDPVELIVTADDGSTWTIDAATLWETGFHQWRL